MYIFFLPSIVALVVIGSICLRDQFASQPQPANRG
jgi:hypothetical protein